MTSRGRLGVLMVSVPVLVFAVVGGFMGKAMARQGETLSVSPDFRRRRAVDHQQLRRGGEDRQGDARRDARSGRRSRSRQRLPRRRRRRKPSKRSDIGGPGRTGIELTRQYYLRVIAARDGLARGDVRVCVPATTSAPSMDNRPATPRSTRACGCWPGKPGTKVTLAVLRGNAAEPHEVDARARGTARRARPRAGWCLQAWGISSVRNSASPRPIRFATKSPRSPRAARRARGRSARHGVWRRRERLAAARLFVPTGTLAFRQERGKAKEAVAAAAGDGSVTLPMAHSDRQRHVGSGGALRGGAHRQQARDHFSASARSDAQLGSASCGCPTAAACCSPSVVSHAQRSGDQREGSDAGRRGRTTRRRVRSTVHRPPMRRSTKRSNI